MERDFEKMKAMVRQLVRREIRHDMIAKAAYYHAEQRGFQNGDTIGDWLASEKEIDQNLMNVFLSFGSVATIKEGCYSDQGRLDNKPGKSEDSNLGAGKIVVEAETNDHLNFVSRSYMRFQYSE